MVDQNMHPLTLPIRQAQNMRLMVHTRINGQVVAKWRQPVFDDALGIWCVRVSGYIHPLVSFVTTGARYPTFIGGTPIKIPARRRVPNRSNSHQAMKYAQTPGMILLDVIFELEKASKPNRLLIAEVRKLSRKVGLTIGLDGPKKAKPTKGVKK